MQYALIQSSDTKKILESTIGIHANTLVKQGDIFQLNQHRIMCGDSTKEQDISRLMNGKLADLILTDPPYLTTDLSFDKDGFNLELFIKNSIKYSKNNAYLSIFAPVEMQAIFAQYWKMRFSGCWLKDRGGMRTHSAKKPMNQWELYCIFAHPNHKISNLTWNKIHLKGEPYKREQYRRGYRRDGKDQIDRASSNGWTQEGYFCINNGTRQQTDVIKASGKCGMTYDERTMHPTQKPLKVFSTFIQWFTNKNEIGFDPFLGSGTALIACELHDRVCYGIEISADYVDMIIRRYMVYMNKLHRDIDFSHVNGNLTLDYFRKNL